MFWPKNLGETEIPGLISRVFLCLTWVKTSVEFLDLVRSIATEPIVRRTTTPPTHVLDGSKVSRATDGTKLHRRHTRNDLFALQVDGHPQTEGVMIQN